MNRFCRKEARCGTPCSVLITPEYLLPSLVVGSRPRSHLFTSGKDRTDVHNAPKFGKKTIRYVSLHFRDQRGAAFIRQRNRTENCVLMYEQKPYPGQCEHNYSLHGIGWCCVELLRRISCTFFDYEVAEKK